ARRRGGRFDDRDEFAGGRTATKVARARADDDEGHGAGGVLRTVDRWQRAECSLEPLRSPRQRRTCRQRSDCEREAPDAGASTCASRGNALDGGRELPFERERG